MIEGSNELQTCDDQSPFVDSFADTGLYTGYHGKGRWYGQDLKDSITFVDGVQDGIVRYNIYPSIAS